jgi:electron transfer flavoprotein alpha subunit
VVDGVLVAAKPAFAGALVADITCTSPLQLVTVRPGVLPLLPRNLGGPEPKRSIRPLEGRGRVVVRARQRDDDVEVLARAEVVIGVGTGVAPAEYEQLSPLATLLGAELAATRKVTDKGWAPRSRQVGITGRSIAPRLYVALGLSGKFNHMVGVRAAGTVLAVNDDPDALVFGFADVGIVGDWHEVVPALAAALRVRERLPA